MKCTSLFICFLIYFFWEWYQNQHFQNKIACKKECWLVECKVIILFRYALKLFSPFILHFSIYTRFTRCVFLSYFDMVNIFRKILKVIFTVKLITKYYEDLRKYLRALTNWYNYLLMTPIKQIWLHVFCTTKY